MTYPCLVLDHDDTVVNSTATVHYPCFAEYTAKFFPKAKRYTLEEYVLKNFDPGVYDFFHGEVGMTEEDMKHEQAYWHEYVQHHVPQVYDGMRDILWDYVHAGGTICVVSHSLSPNILRDYRENGLPEPDSLIEADYQELVRAVCADSARARSEADLKMQDMLDYYTLWAHQIKTPIAAMDLLLQEDDSPHRGELEMELLKIGQYVEMVLSYLRLDSDSTDYVLREYPLDDILRQAVRKFAKMFILKKITLDFQETGKTVLTDEKWLLFVVEQVLSNALKYTPAGGTIRIYGDGATVVIADNGIGIREEDQARVFEKGFTGYNGRADKKSTGIGLYLCRQVMDRLNHGISLTSRPGQGTLVRLGTRP